MRSMTACAFAVVTVLSAPGAFAAPAPAPGASAPPPASDGGILSPSQWKLADDAVERAEIAAMNLEETAAGGKDGSGCPKDVTGRVITADVKAGKLPKDLTGNILLGIVKNGEQWELFNACTALASKNPGVCAEIVATDPDLPPKQLQEHPETTMRGRCAAFAAILPVYRAYDAKDPSFDEKCAALAPSMDGLVSPDAMRKVCLAWKEYKESPDAFVDAYTAAIAPAPSRQEALDALQKLVGDPKLCDGQTYPSRKDVCRERAAFQKSLASKDKTGCRSGLCRAMQGEGPEACEPYALEVKKAACRSVYGPRYVEEETRAFQEQADQALNVLASRGLDGLKSLKAVNERLDRLFAARARLDAAADRIAPKILSAKPAAPK